MVIFIKCWTDCVCKLVEPLGDLSPSERTGLFPLGGRKQQVTLKQLGPSCMLQGLSWPALPSLLGNNPSERSHLKAGIAYRGPLLEQAWKLRLSSPSRQRLSTQPPTFSFLSSCILVFLAFHPDTHSLGISEWLPGTLCRECQAHGTAGPLSLGIFCPSCPDFMIDLNSNFLFLTQWDVGETLGAAFWSASALCNGTSNDQRRKKKKGVANVGLTLMCVPVWGAPYFSNLGQCGCSLMPWSSP